MDDRPEQGARNGTPSIGAARPGGLRRFDGLARRLGRAAWEHYRAILLFSLAGSLLALASVPGLRLHFDASELVPEDDPAAETFRLHQRLFGETSPLVIQLVRGDTAPAAFDDLTLRFARALESIDELTSVTWRAYDLEADGTVERLRAAVLDPATAGPQAWSERLSGDGVLRQLRRLRRRLLSVDDAATRAWLAEDPLDLRRLLFESDQSRSPSRLKSFALTGFFDDPDGEWRLVFAQPDRPSADAEYCLRLRKRVDDLASELVAASAATSTVHLRYGGLHGAVAESQELLMRDMARITGAALLLIGLILWLSLRRRIFALITFLPLAVSLCLFLGLVRWFFNPIYSHSIGVGAVVLGLGLDIGLHLTARYLLIHRGLSGVAAIEEVYSHAGLPILIGVLTTALAFLSLLVAHDAALSQFGLLMALGLLLTLAVTLLMFPALVRWLMPSDAEATSNEPGVRLVSLAVFERFGRRPALVILVWLAILGASIHATWGFSFDMRLSLFFARDLDAFAVGEDLAEIYGTSFSQTMEVGLAADNLETALEAQRRLDAGLRELVASGGIGGFAPPSAYLPYPSSVAEQSEAIDQLRGTIAEIAPGLGDLLAANGLRGPPSLDRYVALLTSLWPPDPSSVTGAYNLDLAPRPLKMLAARDGDRLQLRTIVWPPPLPGAAEFDQHGRMAAELAAIEVPGAEMTVTSEMLLFERHNEAMLEDFGPVTLTSALLVLLAAGLFFRSPMPTLLMILPAAAAIPCTLAVAVWLGLPVPPVAICFLAIILGVGIDDGVHLLAAATRGQDVWNIVRETGSILLLTSLSTACGFGVLVLAHHPALAVLGKIVALGVMICWLTTIGLLAPLVAWLQPRGYFDSGAAKRERDG